MSGPDGPEEREAEQREWFEREMEREYRAEQAADELRDTLIDIIRSQVPS